MLELPRGREFKFSRRKIISPDQIAEVRKKHAGQTLIVAGGSFDLLHTGHISFLEHAKAQGDVLFALVSSDKVARERKGPNRPIHCQQERAQAVAALGCVDYVVPFDYGMGAITLGEINPALWARGLDAMDNKPDEHYRKVLEEKGINIVFVGSNLTHSSEIIRRIRE